MAMTIDEIEKAFRRGCCSEARLAKEGCDVCGPQMEAIAAVRKMAEELEAINAPFHGGALHHIEKLHDDQRESRDREEALVLKLDAAAEDLDQARVQLAGCGVAALGGTKDPATQGMYGWSQAYQDTLDLRLRFDALVKAVEKVAAVAVPVKASMGFIRGALNTAIHAARGGP